MVFCLKVNPIEPCQTGWLWNKSKVAKTCQNTSKTTRTNRSSLEHASNHLWAHRVASSVYLTTLFTWNHSNYQFCPHLPSWVIFSLFPHKSFVRLSPEDILSLNPLKCMCSLIKCKTKSNKLRRNVEPESRWGHFEKLRSLMQNNWK